MRFTTSARPADAASPSRRRALQMAALAATAQALATTGSAVAADRPAAGRIDTHHHALPPRAREWAVENGLLPEQGGPNWGRWDKDETFGVMEANGIAAGVVSMPAPSMAFRDRALAISGSRAFNESAADLVRDHPTRFGFFAYLPLLHVDVALKEAAYALDQLNADGVLMMNQAGGRYLGDPAYEPLFAELDRRGAVIMTHPAGLPGVEQALPGVNEWVADFMLDTTRCALNLITTGTLDRYRRISVILSHAGGFLPYIGGRAELADNGPGPGRDAFRRGLRRFHFDTAMPASPYAAPTLLAAVGSGRLLYGTDWNQREADPVKAITRALDHDPALTARDRAAINRGNALRLLPRLAARLN